MTAVGDTASVTVGRASSSVRVTSTAVGCVSPWVLAAVPVTRTVLSGASTALPVAVSVTVPVLAVCPAATVSTVFVLSAKSSATGAAATVIVVAALDARFSVAVTVVTLPSSVIVAGDNASVTVGSSSVTVTGNVTSSAGSNSFELLASSTACVTVTVSLVPSASSTARAVTVCAVFQVLVVNVRSRESPPFTVMATLSLLTRTFTPLVGCTLSFTVYVALVPSSTENVLSLNTIPFKGIHWPKITVAPLLYPTAKTTPPLLIMSWVTVTLADWLLRAPFQLG